MSYEQIGRLTLAQLRNIQFEGKPPRPGNRVFRSSEEARAWREEQQRGV